MVVLELDTQFGKDLIADPATITQIYLITEFVTPVPALMHARTWLLLVFELDIQLEKDFTPLPATGKPSI